MVPAPLYELDAWTLPKEFKKRLDGTYTKMLRVVKNIMATAFVD